MTSVPFTIGNVFGGLGIAHGVLRNVADDLVLEIQVKDGVFGLLRSEVKEVRIPLCSIEEISLDRMWAVPLQLLGLGSWLLRIRTMHMASVVEFPDMKRTGFGSRYLESTERMQEPCCLRRSSESWRFDYGKSKP